MRRDDEYKTGPGVAHCLMVRCDRVKVTEWRKGKKDGIGTPPGHCEIPLPNR
ncbi:hypothetical protein GCM10027361_24960 [Erwinia aphidicola]